MGKFFLVGRRDNGLKTIVAGIMFKAKCATTIVFFAALAFGRAAPRPNSIKLNAAAFRLI